MRIFIIESAANGVDLAQRLVQAGPDIEVTLFTETSCPHVWARDGLRIIAGAIDEKKVLAHAESERSDLLINFNAACGARGLLEAASARDIPVVGCGQSFAATELDKRGFKRWLVAQGFATPAIQCEGLMDMLLLRANTLQYPLVVKPDYQCGPATVVCHTPTQLEAYLRDAAARFPYCRQGVVFMAEDYVAAPHITQIEYAYGGGNVFILYTVACAYGAKSEANITGAACALAPDLTCAPHLQTIQQLIEALVPKDEAGIGCLQGAVDAEGRWWVLENNARPSACRVWPELRDPLGFLSALQKGDLGALCDRHGYMPPAAMASLLLSQSEPEVSVPWPFAMPSTAVSLAPFSVQQRGGSYTSVQGRPPSLLSAQGDSRAHVKTLLREVLADLRWPDFDALGTLALLDGLIAGERGG